VRAIKRLRAAGGCEPGAEARESATYFLRNALTPVAPEAAPNYFIKTATIAAAELARHGWMILMRDFWPDVPEFSESTLQHVEQYLRRGGGLMIFPAEK